MQANQSALHRTHHCGKSSYQQSGAVPLNSYEMGANPQDRDSTSQSEQRLKDACVAGQCVNARDHAE